MSIIHKVKVNDKWVTVKGGTSISEKEVYIGSDTPPKGTKLWIDPSGEGGEGSAKIYTIPEGVKNATPSAPYEMSQKEIDDFIAQGDFSNTIVRFANPEMSSVLMYPESIAVINGILSANFTISQTLSSNGVATKLGITTYQIQIGVVNGEGMGVLTKTIATINLT